MVPAPEAAQVLAGQGLEAVQVEVELASAVKEPEAALVAQEAEPEVAQAPEQAALVQERIPTGLELVLAQELAGPAAELAPEIEEAEPEAVQAPAQAVKELVVGMEPGQEVDPAQMRAPAAQEQGQVLAAA